MEFEASTPADEAISATVAASAHPAHAFPARNSVRHPSPVPHASFGVLSVSLPPATNLGSVALVKAAETSTIKTISQQASPAGSPGVIPQSPLPFTAVQAASSVSPATPDVSPANRAAAESKAVLQNIMLSPTFRQHSVAYLQQAAAQHNQV